MRAQLFLNSARDVAQDVVGNEAAVGFLNQVEVIDADVPDRDVLAACCGCNRGVRGGLDGVLGKCSGKAVVITVDELYVRFRCGVLLFCGFVIGGHSNGGSGLGRPRSVSHRYRHAPERTWAG